MPDLLIELLSEEIPARMQPRAMADLQRLVTDGLVEAGLTYAHAGAFATPRRLTLAVEGLTPRSPDTVEERRGPKVGAPDKAIDGFARGAGVSRNALTSRDDGKGAAWFARIERPGRDAAAIVTEVLERTIRDFPWPKSMRWGAGSLRWVRPLHRILCILSDESGHEVAPLTVDGIAAGDVTEGHRFMAPGEIRVSGFDDYAAKLRRAFVVLSPGERAETIRNDAANLAFAAGLEVVADDALLAEIAGLVEWPVTLMGDIDALFLDLPAEVLQTSMREHQKFLSVRDRTGRITGFVTVANRETADDGAIILAGNRRVLSARLADAAFFYANDLRVAEAGMQPWLDALGNVTFHNKLGSQKDRIERIAALAREIAPSVGADPDRAEQAARLAKADLASQMVYEFPDLQGVMGRHYIAAAGYEPEIAAVAPEHYAPLGPSDAVPTAPLSVAVALADKIDTLTGFWAIDEKPTGSKDPFALRRAALGLIRICLENSVPANFEGWMLNALNRVRGKVGLGITPIDNVHDLIRFCEERQKVLLRSSGIRHDVFDAALTVGKRGNPSIVSARAEALSAFLGTEDGANLLHGFRRSDNILSQAEEKDGVAYEYGPDVKFADDDAERALFAALDAAEAPIAAAMEAENFGDAMSALAALRAPIDAFFEAVQVNDPRQVIRRNRLNLLSRIRTLCLSVADLRRIEG